MDKENVAHTRGGIFFSPNKEKKNVILSFAKTWVAHEKSQIEKSKHHIPSLLGKLANQSC